MGENITQMLQRGRVGDQQAQEQALAMMYGAIRQIARRLLRQERGAFSLSAGDLVQEALLKLFGGEQPDWTSRTQLLAYSARCMRQFLVSAARRRQAEKRPQSMQRVCLTEIEEVASEEVDLVKLDAVLDRLDGVDARQAQIVEMKFFAGMTLDEIAAALDISPITVSRQWRMARAWLKRELESAPPG